MFNKKFLSRLFLVTGIALSRQALALAAVSATAQESLNKGMSFWNLIVAGGTCMIFLGMASILAVAIIIYHFMYVRADKLIPADFSETLLDLLEKKEFTKATSLCRQQDNLISSVALKGLVKMSKGKTAVVEAIQQEGKARLEKIWQQLTYLGDIAVVAPMIGLLGTVLGMIHAFNYFKLGVINPVILAQGLAKAMINTAFGLIVTVPSLVFFAYFRGRVTAITSEAERISSEIVQHVSK